MAAVPSGPSLDSTPHYTQINYLFISRAFIFKFYLTVSFLILFPPITHLHLVLGSRMVQLYLHSPICLHGTVLITQLSTGITLVLHPIILKYLISAPVSLPICALLMSIFLLHTSLHIKLHKLTTNIKFICYNSISSIKSFHYKDYTVHILCTTCMHLSQEKKNCYQ
jgi:hypothetical protein